MFIFKDREYTGSLLPTAYVVRGKVVLTRVCPSIHLSVHKAGGDPSQVQPGGGEVDPGQVQTGGGTPARSDQGQGYPSQVQWEGVPPARCNRGYPRWGTPLAGWGTPQGWVPLLARPNGRPKVGYPLAGMGYPPARDGVPPGTGQQMEYLIRRGRYAS